MGSQAFGRFWIARIVELAGRVGSRLGVERPRNSHSSLIPELLESRTMLTAVTWTGAAGDNLWHSQSNWSNNQVPTIADDVTIDLPDSNPTIIFNATTGDRSVRSLLTRENINFSGGTLNVATTATLDAGAAATLQGGGIAGGTVLALSGGTLQVAGSGTLTGVTLNADVTLSNGTNLSISNGLTLNSTITLATTGSNTYLYFKQGTQSLTGTGQVVLGGTSTPNYIRLGNGGATTLTVTGVTIRGKGNIDQSTVSSLTLGNQGTIAADVSGQSLNINVGTLSNTGGLLRAANGGVLDVGGTVTTGGLGVFDATGGTVNISGTLNNTGETVNLSPATGSLRLSGTIVGGTIAATGGAQLISSGGTLTGVTLNADVTLSNGTNLSISNGLTLNSTITLATTGSGTYLYFRQGTQSLTGTGQVVLGGTSTPNYIRLGNGGATTLTVTGVTIRGKGNIDQSTVSSLTLGNQGTIAADVSGQSLNINVGTLSNTGGLLRAANGGVLDVGGTVTTGGLGVFDATGGTVNISGTLNNTGETVNLSPATGSLRLSGTIVGGTIAATGGAQLISSGGTLTGVTLNADVTLSNGTNLSISNGLTLNSTITLATTGSGTYLYFRQGTQSLTGTGQVVLGGTSTPNYIRLGNGGATTLTVTGVTIRGKGNIDQSTVSSLTLGNQGTIAADVSGQSLNINVGTLSNTGGLLRAANGGVLDVGGTVTTGGLGVFDATGGTVNISGTLNNTGETVNLSPATGSLRLSGTIVGGTIAATGGAQLISSGGTLTGVTLNADVTLSNGTNLSISNGLTLNSTITLATTGSGTYLYFKQGTQSLTGTGQVVLGGTSTPNYIRLGNGGATTLTVTGVTIRGKGNIDQSTVSSLTLGNQGTIAADVSGQSLNINVGTLSNTGGLLRAANGGVLDVGGTVTTGGLGVFDATGGTVNISGTLNNTGETVNLSPATGSLRLSGTIVGGTIAATGGAQLISSGGTLTGVTLNADVTLSNGTNLSISNGLTLNSTITLATTGSGTYLYFKQGTQSLTGTGQVVLGGTSTPNYIRLGNGGATTLTVTGVTIRGKGNIDQSTVSSLTLGNQGTIAADVSGQSLNINVGTLSNTGGLLRAANGGVLDVGGTVTTGGLGVFDATGGTVNISGTLNNTGETVNLSPATGSLRLSGTIVGGTIAATGGAQLISSGGTLTGVTLNADVTLSNGTNLSISNGLTLNSTITLATTGSGTYLYFKQGTQSLTGTGQVVLGGTSTPNYIRLGNGGATTLTVTGVTIRGKGNIDQSTVSSLTLGNQGTIAADVSGQSLSVSVGTFNNQSGGTLLASSSTLTVSGVATNLGSLRASGSGRIDFSGGGTFDGSDLLSIPTGSQIELRGNLLGSSTNRDLFAGSGTLFFDGAGTVGSPQLFEAMSNDVGTVTAGFSRNFVYGTIILSNNTYVRLADQSDNYAGGAAEAIYVNSLIVPAGTTLDLNGLHLYARAAQISGTVTGGTIGQIADSGAIATGTPTPGVIAVPGELDEWTFFANANRSVTIFANPGTTGSNPALAPAVQRVQVSLVDAANNVIATASSASNGQIVSLSNIQLPVSGNYKILVRAAASAPANTGNYTVTLWDVTPDVASVALNQLALGNIETPFAIDRWVFSGTAGQQIRFDLRGSSTSGLRFSLRDPFGAEVFTNIGGDSALLNLGETGQYTLTALGVVGSTGQYSFRIDLTSVTDLPLGAPLSVANPGNDGAAAFRINTGGATPLLVRLFDSNSTNRNELYVSFGRVPTRTDYDYRYDLAASADQNILIPSAQGTLYALVYGQSVPVPGTISVEAIASSVVIRSASPERSARGSVSPITISGAGFRPGVVIELVSATNDVVATAFDVQINSFTSASAKLPLASVAQGVYGLRVRMPDGSTDTLSNFFTVLPPGQGRLETRLIMPRSLGRHAIDTIYVEYANTGNAAIPAPLLRLQSADADDSDKPILTLDQSRLTQGFWTNNLAEGFSHSIQILGSGASPGILAPGERMQVPVYYAGLLQPWNFSDNQVEMEIRVFDASSTDIIPWGQLQSGLRPYSIGAEAWGAIYGNIITNVGSDWGDFVQMLSDNAQFLSRLGQRVVDVDELWSFEVQQAIGFNPVRTLASAIDGSIPTPGGDLSFGRTYGLSIDQRFESSIFGRGWSAPWQTRLAVDADGSVNVFGASGSRRRFEPDARRSNAFFSLYGDPGTLTRISGEYEIREQDGSIVRFSAGGRLLWSQDPNGNRVTMGYTGTQLTSLTHSSGASLTIAYNAAGLVSGITDSASRATTFTYDATNQYLLTSTAWDGEVTTYTYSTAAGSPRQHALTSITANGTTRTFQYDALGRLAATAKTGDAERIDFTYDSAGRVSTTDATGGATSFDYDHRGLLGRVVDAFGQVTTAEYGADRRLSRIVDPLGQNQTFTWCSCGSLTSVTNELGNATRFSYEYVGANNTIRRMTSFTDANGNITRYTYDNRGNLTATIYPTGSTERINSYDPVGNPLSFVNRRGQTMGYTYNAAGQITRQTFADNTFIEFAYDVRGNLLTATEPGNRVTTFQYDAGDRLTRVTYPTGLFLSFGYDGFGRRTSMTDKDGFQVNYAYDAAGRLQRLTDGSGGLFVEYTYDAAGRLSRKDNGNGTSTTYVYDPAGQVLAIVNRAPASAGGTVNSRFDYTYDALGRRTSMTTLDGTWTYGYDPTGQLILAVFAPVPGSPIAAQSLEYVYDAVGNRIRTIENGVTTNYTTNNLNQYTQVGGDVLVYDADGNLVSRSGPSGNATYTYDQQNRLVRVVTPSGVWEYQYDAFGSRIASTMNGQRTEFLLDPTGLVDVVGEYTSAGALVARYIHGLGLTTRQEGANSQRSFYDCDAIGSAAGMTNASGAVVNRYAYTPFGESIQRIELLSNPFEYVGQFGVQEEGNGLQFMRARFTDLDAGRFLSPDPMGLLGHQSNFYTYAANVPNSFVDATGAFITAPIALAGAGIGAIVGAGVYGVVWLGTGQGSIHGLAGAALGGALTGGIVGATGGVAGWGIVAGAFGSGVSYGVGSAGSGFSWAGFGANVLVGGALGGIPVGLGVLNVGTRWGLGAPQFYNTFLGLNKHGSALFNNSFFTTSLGSLFSSILNLFGPSVSGGSGTSSSVDPNALYGPSGFGPQSFVRSDALLPYRIEFENYGPGSLNEDGSPVASDRWATAPAQRVVVTNTLSPDLDLSTFRYTGFGWGDFVINLLTPSQSWQQVINMSFNGRTFEVWFEAEIDYDTRQLRMVFQSIDPQTSLPPDVLTGFLPPEDGTGRGKGFITYTVAPVAGLPSGREIRNVALIQFDGQIFIATNQIDPLFPALGTDPEKEALVTIDAGKPTSAVTPLAPFSPLSQFTVRWSGNDDLNGSGVNTYTVYVSIDGGAYSPWLVGTKLTESIYTGLPGRTYSFYSVATDNVGLVEAAPAAADATTFVGDYSASWDGQAGDGNWSNPVNWVGDRLPGASDDVYIGASASVTITGLSASIRRLVLDGTLTVSNAIISLGSESTIAGLLMFNSGTLTSRRPISVPGTLRWSGGVLAGHSVSVTGTLDLPGSADRLLAADVNVTGAMTFSGPGTLSIQGGSITIESGGTFTASANGRIRAVEGSPEFANKGTAQFAGSGSFMFGSEGLAGLVLTNAGTFQVISGAVDIDAIQFNAGGIFTIESDSSIRLTGGSSQWTVAQFAGGGSLEIVGGSHALNSITGSIAAIDLQGGTLTVNTTVAVSGNLDNAATLVLGSYARLNIGSLYRQTESGTLRFNALHIGGSPIYGRLTANTAQLAGALILTYTDNSLAVRGDNLQLLNATAITGAFTTRQLPGQTNPDWKNVYIPTATGIRFLTTALIDFDNDGSVNLSDFFSFFADWDNFSTNVDLNGDGEVDLLDYFLFFNLFDKG